MKKLIRNLCIASSLLVGSFVVDLKPAHAWADFCNDTGGSIWVSFGTPKDDGNWNSFGWYKLRDNSCHRFYPHDLRERRVSRLYYFVYNNGRNVTPTENQGSFCVNYGKSFSYTVDEVSDFCGKNTNTRWEKFAGFDVGNGRNTTFTIR